MTRRDSVSRNDTRIGVVGGYGAVGRAAVAQLVQSGAGPVVVAGRHPELAAEILADFPDVAAERLDLGDPAALAAFCSRCRVAAGADYVDAGGDDVVHDLLAGGPLAGTAVLSAGMLPGLTGLLPRALAANSAAGGAGPAARLTAFAGGEDVFTVAAAVDYVESLRNGFGRSNAAWRGGACRDRAAAPLLDAEIAWFPGTVAAYPFLSTEMERVARDLGLAELTFFNVFPGAHLREALAEAAGGGTGGGAVLAAAERLVAASRLDLFGSQPFQRLVFRLEDAATVRTLVLTGAGASQLTGTMAALTATWLLAGEVKPGLHYAADVVDPGWAVAALETAPAVVALQVFEGSAAEDGEPEEGEL
jgi:hypothetical protein